MEIKSLAVLVLHAGNPDRNTMNLSNNFNGLYVYCIINILHDNEEVSGEELCSVVTYLITAFPPLYLCDFYSSFNLPQ